MEMAYQERVKELEAKLEKAKEESGKVNTVVETKVVTKTKIIKEKGETIVQQVDKIIPVEKDCTVPKEAIDVHNEAARMNKAIQELRKGDKK
jgi:galactokinase